MSRSSFRRPGSGSNRTALRKSRSGSSDAGRTYRRRIGFEVLEERAMLDGVAKEVNFTMAGNCTAANPSSYAALQAEDSVRSLVTGDFLLHQCLVLINEQPGWNHCEVPKSPNVLDISYAGTVTGKANMSAKYPGRCSMSRIRPMRR